MLLVLHFPSRFGGAIKIKITSEERMNPVKDKKRPPSCWGRRVANTTDEEGAGNPVLSAQKTCGTTPK